ncbi:MAG: CHAT domain-containing protein, partial [Anaerolineae bacterium]|nr:CHAT domain-containing protein [Anaerolineae bacterium]
MPMLESEWTAVYERLANLYFARDTEALLQLTTTAKSLPLQSPPAQHMRHYFQGVAAFRQADYAAALDSFAGLLAQPDLDTHLRARALNSRAVVCRVTGQLEEAMSGYRASLLIWQELENDHYQGIVTLNLGIISYNLRRYEQAVAYLRQAERYFEAAGSADWLAKTQSELGLVQRDWGHWDESLAYLEAYIRRSEQQEAWEDVGVGEINRGEVLLFKGEATAAKAALQRALTLTVSRTYRVDPLLFLGLAHQADGELEQAERYYQEALTLATEIDRREILPHVYYYLGDVVCLQGKSEDALAYWQQAADVIEETHTPLRDESLKISLLGRWQQVYEALILHCAALGRVEEAFAWAERARARAFAEGLADDRQEQPVVSCQQLQAAIPKSTTLLCYFTTGVLEQDIPLLRAIPAANPLRDHILTPAKTLLFVITSSEIQLHECPLDPNLFATSSPRGFDATRFLKTAVLQHLSATLLNTLDARRATLHHLVIIPHGPLHRVPFTAMLAQADNPPTLSFAPSGTIFASKRVQGEKGARETAVSCLTVGYNGIRSSRYLNYADGEVEAVAGIMNGEVWLGSAPKKAVLAERAETCRWLHIACHGWFDDADPLASYLETGAGEELTAREVLETWSLQAELVTLSACETGISQILRGDEPMGLVR